MDNHPREADGARTQSDPRNPSADAAKLSSRIARLAQHASIESSSSNLADVERYAEWLAPGTEVYIPWLPGAPFHHTLSVAQRLRQVGLEPVPHFAAKRLDSYESAAAFLRELHDHAAVTRLMLIGGDTERAAGPFATALAVIESGLLEAHGIKRIGIAAYPEGHPRIAPAALEEALWAKLERARAHEVEPCVVTQFCFDGSAVVRWLERVRGAGLQGNVRIGAVGPAKIRSLLAYAARCGVTHSVRALWNGPVSLRGLLATHGPEEVLGQVAAAALASARLEPIELHLFAFGGFKGSALWLRSAGAGEFAAMLEQSSAPSAVA
jgi:methylenetetrahydrofolate reductase (NADPH)